MDAASTLVVDDNPSVRQLVQIVLQRSGRNVLTATDGIDAVLLLERQSFELVITDFDMPRLGGIEVIAEVRRLHPHTRLVAMSGEWNLGGMDYRRMARSLGVRAFLTKPFSLRELLAMVDSDLSRPVPIEEPVAEEGCRVA